MRKAREEKAKAESETAERESSCEKAKDKENSVLKRQRAKGGLLVQCTVCAEGTVLPLAYN